MLYLPKHYSNNLEMKKLLLFITCTILLFSCNSKSPEKTIQKNSLDKIKQVSTKGTNEKLIGKDYLIDDIHSYIGFKIKYFGYSPVRGRFDSFDGTIFYDPENLESLSVSTIIELKSINTANQRRDNDLKKESAWFDVPKHPLAKFVSTGVYMHDNGFYLYGNLTIKGITKSIKIDCKKPSKISRDSFKNFQFNLYGTFTISRKDFNVVGGGFWTTIMEDGLMQLSDEVEMEVEFHSRRADYHERYKEMDSTNVRKILVDKIRNKNIEQGLKSIDSLHAIKKISSGALSTVGYILLNSKKEKEALDVFIKKKELFGDNAILQNQLGLTHLLLKEKEKAMKAFQTAAKMDSVNSRSVEYIKLLEAMNNE